MGRAGPGQILRLRRRFKKAGASRLFAFALAPVSPRQGGGKIFFPVHETFTDDALLMFVAGLADKQTCVLLR
jgi:hypothetical protein